MVVARLFHDRPRTDPSPSKESEPTFRFLDRAPGLFWQRVRDQVERWLATYPAAHQFELIRRLKSNRPSEHRSAWWELHVFALFQAMGAEVEVIVDPSQRRPDFLVTTEAGKFYSGGDGSGNLGRRAEGGSSVGLHEARG